MSSSLGPLIAERGSNVEVDYAFKRSLICPQCGAHGGGLIVEASN
jgi:hypothetical protein